MARFNIDAHLSSGKRLDWLAYADEGEKLEQVVESVRFTASLKFGGAVLGKRWTHRQHSNGCITVSMHA